MKTRDGKTSRIISGPLTGLWTVFHTALRRSRAMMIVAVAISVGLLLIGGVSIGQTEISVSGIRIGLLDQDRSTVSADLTRYLSEDLGLDVRDGMSLDELKTELLDKRISAIIEVPEGFEAAALRGAASDGGAADAEPGGSAAEAADTAMARIRLTVMGDYANEAFLRAYLDGYAGSLKTLIAAAGGDAARLHTLLADTAANDFSVQVADKNEELLRTEAERNGFGSMLGLFEIISFLLAIGLCSMLFADRKGGTFTRVQASNVRAGAYTTAMGLVGVVISLLIIALPLIFTAVARLDAGMPMGVIILIVFVYSLFVIAFGLFAGLWMTSQEGIVALVVIVATISSMVGGAFFPLETAPEIFQKLAVITPQYWFNDVVDSYFFTDAGHWGTGVCVILLMAAIFFILAGVRFVMKGSAKTA
ncbi:hypothetical protein AGMMS49983_05310 [Clostridia bacterium]|nr:hypothetical protein AGMMS49983_05310 [Clostridia bacterium]